MTPASNAIVLAVLVAALIGHHFSQKALLAKGWKAADPQPQIKRLGLNGMALFVIAVAALVVADWPVGLAGILLLIESAVCFAFSKKLRNKRS